MHWPFGMFLFPFRFLLDATTHSYARYEAESSAHKSSRKNQNKDREQANENSIMRSEMGTCYR